MSLVQPLVKPLVRSLVRPLVALGKSFYDLLKNIGEVWPLRSNLIGSDSTPITLTRAGTKIVQDVKGNYQSYAVDTPGFGVGLSVEGASTNKCTNYNFAPDAGLTDITQDATITTTRVHIDTVPEPYKSQILNQFQYLSEWNDYVYKSVNSTGAANLNAAGACGNTNAHSISCFGVSVSGNANIRLSGQATLVPFGSVFGRVKSQNLTPSIISRIFQIRFTDADTIYWLGNQLEESSTESSPIVTSGATVTRAADNATVSTTGWAVNDTTIYIECPKGIVETGAIQYLWASQVDGSNWTVLFYNSGNLIFQRRIAGVAYNATVPYTADGTPFTVACTNHSANGSDIHISTGATSTPNATVGDMPLAATARLGAFSTGTFPMYGELKYFAPDITGVNSDLNDLYWAVRNG